jgi:hypothetical protein
MDIISLNEYLTSDINQNNLVNLFKPAIMNPTLDGELETYIVGRDDEMRIDLIFRNIYELESNEVGIYLGNIDVLLTLNNIDNPLSPPLVNKSLATGVQNYLYYNGTTFNFY